MHRYHNFYNVSAAESFTLNKLLYNSDISLIFQDISMKLGGHMGHGSNSSYMMYDRICHAVIEL